MTAVAADRGHLLRWAASAAVVVVLHGLGVAALLAWHDPVGVGDESPAIVIDLAPYVAASESTEDLPPGPLQQEAAAPAPQPQPQVEKVEPKPDDKKVEAKIEPEPQDKIELPPAPVPPVAALAPPEAVEPPPVTPPEPTVTAPSDTPPAPATTAPAREHHASVAETNKWHRDIVAQIERHKSYPPAARARGQKGVVQVAFSIDKDGRLVASRVAQASGHALLDEAAMAALQTSQFPPAPSGTSGNEFSFTVPIEFKLR